MQQPAPDPPGRPAELALPCTAPEMLRAARGRVSPDLVPAAAWKRLEAIVDPLPPLAREAAFECRLEAASSPVDFELCLRTPCRARLAEALASGALAPGAAPAWQEVTGLLQAWCDPRSPLHAAIHALWLEFDAGGEDGPAAPFAVLTLDREACYAGGRADPESLFRLLRLALDRIAGGLAPGHAAGLARVLDGLPPAAQVLHAALRPTPEGPVVRLVVAMPWRQIPDTLASLDWPGPRGELLETLSDLCPTTLVHSLNLDLHPELGPRIGIEFHHPTAPRLDPRWRRVLNVLETRGACSPRKRRALEDWGDPAGDPGPGRLGLRRELLLKAVYQAGTPLRAKAYLPFSPVLELA